MRRRLRPKARGSNRLPPTACESAIPVAGAQRVQRCVPYAVTPAHSATPPAPDRPGDRRCVSGRAVPHQRGPEPRHRRQPLRRNALFLPASRRFLSIRDATDRRCVGQVLDLLQANNNLSRREYEAANFAPIPAPGLAPANLNSSFTQPNRLLNLAPRIVQPSRLNFVLLDADDDASQVNLRRAPTRFAAAAAEPSRSIDRGLRPVRRSAREMLVLADSLANRP